MNTNNVCLKIYFFTALLLFAVMANVQAQDSQDSQDSIVSKSNTLKTLSDSYINLLKEVGLGMCSLYTDSTPFIKDFYFGFGYGPETGLSFILPKISYYNFQNRKNFETYYGIEGTVGVLVAQWYSLDCLYGVKKNKFTLDTSIGAWWYPKQKFDSDPVGPYFHLTMNPKIGIRFWRLWLKSGPSIFLYKDYPKEQNKLGATDFGKIGGMHYNFEIQVNF